MSHDVVAGAAGVSVAFGDTHALRACDFQATAGEIHAIVGENGSGKSTLAKSLAGVVRPQAGTIRVLGSSCRSPREARDLGLAMVFQEVLVAADATVTDNVYLGWDGVLRHAASEKTKRDTVAHLMSRLSGEDIDPDSPAGDHPLDVRQWIVIARALVRDPKILVLDEATAALDLAGSQRLHGEMVRLRDQGGTVLLVTHRIAELTAFADRATVLRDGRNVGVLAGDEIQEDRLLELMSAESDGQRAADSTRPLVVIGGAVLTASAAQIRDDSKPLDFTLHAREVVGVAGLDGQGQGLFVRALAGLDNLAAGVVAAGEGAEAKTVDSALQAERAGIAYVSGDRKRDGIFPNLSILENFAAAQFRSESRAGIINMRAIKRLFEEQVKKLSIKIGKSSNSIESLSGGHQQKVLIGRALAKNPRIIVLNDPARGVDIRTKKELHNHLRQQADSGCAVVYLSTELEEFPGLCDRVVVFRNATIVADVPRDEVEPDRILRAMFGYEAAGSVAEAMGALS
jgi:ribose transport system ATP-binding protein